MRRLQRGGGIEGGEVKGEPAADDDEPLTRHFRRLQGIALVRLKWTPDAFWRTTPHEFYSAIEVFDEMRKAAER